MPTNTTDREGFEAHHADYFGLAPINFKLSAFSNRTYKADDIENRWLGWQAAQAQSAERIMVLEEIIRDIIEPAECYDAGKLRWEYANIDDRAMNAAKSALSPHNPAGE